MTDLSLGFQGLLFRGPAQVYNLTFNPPPKEYWLQKLEEARVHNFLEALPTLTPNPSPCASPGGGSNSSWIQIRSATGTPVFGD